MKQTMSLLAMLFVLCCISATATGQRTITGTVYSSVGNQPLVGATVLVKGTTVGTFTGDDGKFTLRCDDPNPTLVIRYFGFKSEEYEVGGDSEITVTLKYSVTSMIRPYLGLYMPFSYQGVGIGAFAGVNLPFFYYKSHMRFHVIANYHSFNEMQWSGASVGFSRQFGRFNCIALTGYQLEKFDFERRYFHVNPEITTAITSFPIDIGLGYVYMPKNSSNSFFRLRLSYRF